MNHTLLIELFTEELPPKALLKLGDAFAAGIRAGLSARDYLEVDSIATSYATPRRLAVTITNVRSTAPDQELREKILPVSIGLDAAGNASAPLIKKLAAMGYADVGVSQLERVQDGKAESLFYCHTAKGLPLLAGLQLAVEESIARLPVPKLMTYQRPDGTVVQFARPVHRLIALHGAGVVDITLMGLTAGRITQGHRFLSQGEIQIAHADEYAASLKIEGKVIADFAARKESIRTQLLEQAGADQVLMPESLLDEVTSLVEWPVVYTCHFEERFLSVPQECLILTMQTNQKYFALTDMDGKLRARFLVVSNLATTTPQHIIRGNETVVRPRLSDAKFFFEQDQKKTLEQRASGLSNVVYHNKLGSQAERTERVRQLAGYIATELGAGFGADVALAQRAAQLAKADLLTDMVGEFPELQGIMGTYYARIDGEAEEVALAVTEHYQPRFAGDSLPGSVTGTILALADKLETLVGIWGIGLQPTGDRDPFALRRHALGVLRMLIEKQLPLTLSGLLNQTVSLFAGNAAFADPGTALASFIYDRLRGILKDRGFSPAEVEAVVAPQPDQLANILQRLDAVTHFAALPEAAALAAANKRITNILKKTEQATGEIQAALLQEAAESALYSAMVSVTPAVQNAFAAGDFTAALQLLAAIRPQVDAFFTDVMVMAEDPALRTNRLALLASLHTVLNQVADISKLAA